MTLGYAEATQTQNSLVEFGDHADVYVSGSATQPGAASIKALSHNKVDTSAKVSTGGLVSIPQSLARSTGTGVSRVLFEDNARLATQRGDVNIRVKSDSNIFSHAKTSVWGLAGAGASGKAYATVNSTDELTVQSGAEVIANGYLRAYTGRDQTKASIGAYAKSDVFNKTLIPITTGLVARADVTRRSNINIGSGGAMKSARHMYLIADKGVMGALADGTHRFGPEGISADESFGDEITDAQATITVDGTIETGVYNNQFIGFGRDFGTFVADSSTPSATDTTRQTLYYNVLTENWERRSVDNSTLIENIALTTTNAVPTDINADYRSDESVKISFDVGRSLAQDIDDEIAALDAALLTSFDNASAGHLLTRHQTISNRITALSPGGGVRSWPYRCQLFRYPHWVGHSRR